MADSWGLIIVLFFLLAIIIFIIKLFVEFPGLLQLSCVYKEDGDIERKEVNSEKKQTAASPISAADKHEAQAPDSDGSLQQTESWILQNRIVTLEQDVKQRDKQIGKLQKEVVKLKHESETYKKKVTSSNMKGDNVSDRSGPSEEIESLEKISDATIEKGNNKSTVIQSDHCKELRLLNKKITFDE